MTTLAPARIPFSLPLGSIVPSAVVAGKQHRRQHEPNHGEHEKRQLRCAALLRGKGRVVMRYKGADPDHLGLKLMEKKHILSKLFRGLAGGTHHKAAADFVTDLFQVCQTLFPVFQRQSCRMETGVMLRIRRFMTQQITVGAGVIKSPVAFVRTLSDRKSEGTVRVAVFYGPDDIREYFVGIVTVLAALQHEGTEAEPVALVAAGKDLLFRQAVAGSILVASPYPAVIAVVSAVISELYKPPQIDVSCRNAPPVSSGPFQRDNR